VCSEARHERQVHKNSPRGRAGSGSWHAAPLRINEKGDSRWLRRRMRV